MCKLLAVVPECWVLRMEADGKWVGRERMLTHTRASMKRLLAARRFFKEWVFCSHNASIMPSQNNANSYVNIQTGGNTPTSSSSTDPPFRASVVLPDRSFCWQSCLHFAYWFIYSTAVAIGPNLLPSDWLDLLVRKVKLDHAAKYRLKHCEWAIDKLSSPF